MYDICIIVLLKTGAINHNIEQKAFQDSGTQQTDCTKHNLQVLGHNINSIFIPSLHN